MKKNIVLFIDGTWNDDEGPEATNVLSLCRRLQGTKNTVWHYMAGVGTAKPAKSSSRGRGGWFGVGKLAGVIKRVGQNVAGGLAGYGTTSRIKYSYKFLVDNYVPGDQIFLFGFSRGAFAVRSLAGFIDEVGLLFKRNIADVEYAYLLYEKNEKALHANMRRLGLHTRLSDGSSLPVHMIGVWDTVRKLGLPDELQWLAKSYTGYHVTDFPRYVSHIRHALALHEVRPMFEPLLWDEPVACGKSLQQVWFAGAHADVGGGYTDRALADIALEWMVSEAQSLGLRIETNPQVTCLADTFEVHHELRGKFFLIRPKVRQKLLSVQTSGAKDLGNWSVHVSATDRLKSLPLQRYVFGRIDVADAFHEIDRLTGILAMKIAWEWDGLPCRNPVDSSSPSKINGAQPEATGLNGDKWNDFSIGELQHGYALIEKIIQGAADILCQDKEQVQRALMLTAVFCEPNYLIKMAQCLSQLTWKVPQTSQEKSEKIEHLRRLSDFLSLPNEVKGSSRHWGLASISAAAIAYAALEEIAQIGARDARNGL